MVAELLLRNLSKQNLRFDGFGWLRGGVDPGYGNLAVLSKKSLPKACLRYSVLPPNCPTKPAVENQRLTSVAAMCRKNCWALPAPIFGLVGQVGLIADWTTEWHGVNAPGRPRRAAAAAAETQVKSVWNSEVAHLDLLFSGTFRANSRSNSRYCLRSAFWL